MIELMFSIVLMATIFAAVMPLIYSSINNNKDSRLKLIAYEAASQKIEELRDEKISSLQAPNHTYFTVPDIAGSSGDLYITKPLGDTRLAQVECSITWTFQNRSHKIKTVTYMYGGTQ